MEIRFTGKLGRKRRIVYNYLLNNPHASNYNVVKDCEVSPSTVTKVRAAMIEKALIPASPYDRVTPLLKPAASKAASIGREGASEEIGITSTKEMLEIASLAGVDLGESTPEEMLKILTQFYRDPNEAPQIRMGAMNLINKLKSDLQGRDVLGPGKPLTHEDQIERLSMLLKAVGFETSVEAFEVAFGVKEQPSENTTESGNTDTPSVITEVISQTGHDDPTPEPEGMRENNI